MSSLALSHPLPVLFGLIGVAVPVLLGLALHELTAVVLVSLYLPEPILPRSVPTYGAVAPTEGNSPAPGEWELVKILQHWRLQLKYDLCPVTWSENERRQSLM